VFVEERKKEVENGSFGRMHEGCARPLLGCEDDGKEGGKRGEEWSGEPLARITGKESFSAIYGPIHVIDKPRLSC